jgi:hypothetical protein
MRKVLVVSLCLLFVMSSLALARNDSQGTDQTKKIRLQGSGLIDLDLPFDQQGLQASAQADTFVLGEWTFDAAGSCTPEGWVSVDRTLQPDIYWHIDDFAGLGGGSYGNLVPIRGLQSLWCGMRPDPGNLDLCGYARPPGYGNNWTQSWVFKCITVPDTEEVYIDYITSFDSEPGYDGCSVEWASKSTCDSLGHIDGIAASDWTEISYFDGFASDSLRSDTIPAGHQGSVKIRFEFNSDGAWSDQDGLWNTDGGTQLDSITISSAPPGGAISTVYDYEDFEDEAPFDKATLDGDWTAQIYTGYGSQYANLYPGLSLVQVDPCRVEVTCMWAFINTSTETYACGGYPGQIAVPKVNERGQYIHNEVWSPPVDWTPAGAYGGSADLVWDTYWDLPIPNMVFVVWHVRSWVAGCPYFWRDRNFVTYGDGGTWGRPLRPFGDLVRGDAEQIQVALGVRDMCGIWCDESWTGECHTHAPLIDNVEVYRIGTSGPQWSVRDIDQFQDTFPTNGLAVGAGRIDAAIDRTAYTSPTIYTGDSASVLCSDPVDGLAIDPTTGFGGAVYCYISISPPAQPGKMTPAELEEDNFRWPLVDSVMCDGKQWYKFRCDTAFTEPGGPRTGPVNDKWCIDINDNVITNGDTLEYFYGADGNVSSTFWSRGAGTVATMAEVCVLANEMQILPGVGGTSPEADILYVDSNDGRGTQPYFESSFQMMGIMHLVDRYDINGPGSSVANHPGQRVRNVLTQLIPIYRKIIWNTGAHVMCISDEGPQPDKSNDWLMLFTFMDQHTNPAGCGIYLSGDDLADSWAALQGASGPQFRDVYMPHVVVSGDQVPTHGIAPLVIGETGGIFDHGAPNGVDTMVAYGGCPGINDFDVLQPTGSSQLQMTYSGTGNATDGAVISFDSTNALGYPARVVLSGFSYDYIRDDRSAGIPDRTEHLSDIIRWLGNITPDPVGGNTPVSYTYNLRQNYPNPFNPSTRIQYSIKEQAHVTLKIYNVAGQLVKTLVNKEQSPRADGYTVQWSGRSDAGTPVSSGVYFYKLVAKNFTQTKKMVLLK